MAGNHCGSPRRVLQAGGHGDSVAAVGACASGTLNIDVATP